MNKPIQNQNYETVVIDGGARYGMHPIWDKFTGELKYFAFEPDQDECHRLRKHKKNSEYHIIQKALWKSTGIKEFNLLSHKGQSSLYIPNLNSDWFKNTRPLDGLLLKSGILNVILLIILQNIII